MAQYLSIKEQHKDYLLFYRMGDFYELFFDDAKVASRELELVLTGKNAGVEDRIPMCGVPHHAVNSYIEKLSEETNLSIKLLQDGLDNLKETYDANIRLLELNKMYADHLDSHTQKEIEDHTFHLRRLIVNRENDIKSLQDKLTKNVKRILNI